MRRAVLVLLKILQQGLGEKRKNLQGSARPRLYISERRIFFAAFFDEATQRKQLNAIREDLRNLVCNNQKSTRDMTLASDRA